MSPYPHVIVGTLVTGKSIMASSHIRTNLAGITLDASEFKVDENLGADYVVDIGSLFGKLTNGLWRLWARQALASNTAGNDALVVVKNAAPFKVGDLVTIGDSDGADGETAEIESINYGTNTLTMTANVTHVFETAKHAEIYITDGGEMSEVALGYSDVDMELKVRGATSSIGDALSTTIKHGAVLFARLPQWVQDALTDVTGMTGDTKDGPRGFLESKGGNQIEFVE